MHKIRRTVYLVMVVGMLMGIVGLPPPRRDPSRPHATPRPRTLIRRIRYAPRRSTQDQTTANGSRVTSSGTLTVGRP
jgi:hypothetical protein